MLAVPGREQCLLLSDKQWLLYNGNKSYSERGLCFP